jgi:hypothetical protein
MIGGFIIYRDPQSVTDLVENLDIPQMTIQIGDQPGEVHFKFEDDDVGLSEIYDLFAQYGHIENFAADSVYSHFYTFEKTYNDKIDVPSASRRLSLSPPEPQLSPTGRATRGGMGYTGRSMRGGMGPTGRATRGRGMIPNGITSPGRISTNGMSPRGTSPGRISTNGMSPIGTSPGRISTNGMSPRGTSPGRISTNGMSPRGRSVQYPDPYDLINMQ